MICDLKENIENSSPDYIGFNQKAISFYTNIVGKPVEVSHTEEWLNEDTVYSLIYNNIVARIYTEK